MDAKRRKLQHESVRDTSISPDSASTAGMGTPPRPEQSKKAVTVTLSDLKATDERELAKSLELLKKQLSNKISINGFIRNAGKNGMVAAIVDVVQRKTNDLGTAGSSTCPLLKDAIGALANCCYYSTAACLELKQPHVRISPIAVKILTSSYSSPECKFSLVRLIANMCAHKESALCISSSGALLEYLCTLLESDHSPTVLQTLRALRMLIKGSFSKALLQANAAFFMAKLLKKEELEEKTRNDVMELMEKLGQRFVRETGRQVASSDCSDRLQSLFLSNDPTAQRLLVALCQGSTDLRDRLGENDVISHLLSLDVGHQQCALLSTFAQDAWGRAALRESGALDLLVGQIADCSTSSERAPLVSSLRHFIHDTTGMAHLARSRLFVDTVVDHVRKYVERNQNECKPEMQCDSDIYRPHSPLLMEIENDMQNRGGEREMEDSCRLHKDFLSMWAYSPQMSPRVGGMTRSPTYSPPSSGAASPIHSPTTESSSVFRAMSTSVVDGEDSRDGEDSEKTIVESELWLLVWQAQEDSNLSHLIREDVVDSLLSYLALVPSADFRVSRALRRMAQSRSSIDQLLEMQFHTRILNTLCAVPCRIKRFAKRCGRCEKSAEFGREVLREFASHVDSDFGHAFLVRRLESEDCVQRQTAAIAKVALVRDRFRASRRLSAGHITALDLMFEELRRLLKREDFERVAEESTYNNGPPLCAQIIGALSTHIHSTKLRDYFDINAPFRAPERVPCVLKEKKKKEKGAELEEKGEPIGEEQEADEKKTENEMDVEDGESSDFLRFELADGSLLAEVPLAAARENSHYFQGMFSTNLAEKQSKRRNFVFDEEVEGCAAEDMKRFLHYLAGCRDHCSNVETASTCVAMIQLSDRYLCSSLSNWLVSPHGPAERLLDGPTLPLLLPTALAANVPKRFLSACLVSLVRFALSSDVVSTLIELSSSPQLIDSFVEEFKKFVTSN